MKSFYALFFSLLVATALTACGANSMFEAEAFDAATDEKTQVVSKGRVIPEGCISWFDGCNKCTVKDGKLGACTKMACKSEKATAKCSAFAPGFGESSETAKVTEAVKEEKGAVPDTILEKNRKVSADVPENCQIWFDGCNSCVVQRGKLRGCTSKVCTAPGEAKCTTVN